MLGGSDDAQELGQGPASYERDRVKAITSSVSELLPSFQIPECCIDII